MFKCWQSRIACGAILAVNLVMPALAADRNAGSPPKVFENFLACRAIVADRARFACLEKSAADLAAAQQDGQIVVIGREQIQQRHRAEFGFSGGADSAGTEHRDNQLSEIASVVRGTSRDATGKLIFAIADGARWYQLDDRRVPPIANGSKVVIKRGVLGSFFARFADGVTVRVERRR